MFLLPLCMIWKKTRNKMMQNTNTNFASNNNNNDNMNNNQRSVVVEKMDIGRKLLRSMYPNECIEVIVAHTPDTSKVFFEAYFPLQHQYLLGYVSGLCIKNPKMTLKEACVIAYDMMFMNEAQKKITSPEMLVEDRWFRERLGSLWQTLQKCSPTREAYKEVLNASSAPFMYGFLDARFDDGVNMDYIIDNSSFQNGHGWKVLDYGRIYGFLSLVQDKQDKGKRAMIIYKKYLKYYWYGLVELLRINAESLFSIQDLHPYAMKVIEASADKLPSAMEMLMDAMKTRNIVIRQDLLKMAITHAREGRNQFMVFTPLSSVSIPKEHMLGSFDYALETGVTQISSQVIDAARSSRYWNYRTQMEKCDCGQEDCRTINEAETQLQRIHRPHPSMREYCMEEDMKGLRPPVSSEKRKKKEKVETKKKIKFEGTFLKKIMDSFEKKRRVFMDKKLRKRDEKQMKEMNSSKH